MCRTDVLHDERTLAHSASDEICILLVPPRLGGIIGHGPRGSKIIELWQEPAPHELANVEVLLTDGVTPVTGELLDRLPALRWVAVFTAGFDVVDAAMLASRGLAVSYAPGINADDVADHALGQIITHFRRLSAGHQLIASGGWSAGAGLTRSLRDLRAGIVGMGAIGRALARRLEICGVDIRWWGPRTKPDIAYPRMESVLDLGEWAEVLIIACRPTPGAPPLISAEVLAELGPDALLVNVSRGSLVDEPALRSALATGELGAAALDVFEPEPTQAGVWRDIPNVYLTPHTAGATLASVASMFAIFAANFEAFRQGQPLLTPIPGTEPTALPQRPARQVEHDAVRSICEGTE